MAAASRPPPSLAALNEGLVHRPGIKLQDASTNYKAVKPSMQALLGSPWHVAFKRHKLHRHVWFVKSLGIRMGP